MEHLLEDSDLFAHHKKHVTHQTIELIQKDWKKLVPVAIREVVLAKALNRWSHKHKTPIYGYLITKRRLILMLPKETKNHPNHLHEFYKIVAEELKHYFKSEKKLNYELIHGGVAKHSEGSHLFHQKLVYDDILNRLLTGKSINKAYYNAHNARLQDKIRNYNYCSAIDYSGAKGPVHVTKLRS